MLRLGSLFDGIGGWQLAATHNGVTPVWSSEIEKFPLAVTKIRFPNTKQLGDIKNINVDEIEPCEIICAGSPCQDLSVAGKRGGLAGERSGLFTTAIDIIRQMRRRTNGEFPRFFVWENVTGAFSSNKGLDFKTVLEEIGETEIPMPNGNKWADAGLVECDNCEIAWRVLDAKFWGVPQRRRRIFLIVDFAKGRRCASEILFVEPCMSRDIESGDKRKQNIAERVNGSIRSTSETVISMVEGYLPIVLDITHANEGIRMSNGVTPTLKARMGTGGNQVPCVYSTRRNMIRRLTPLECERLQGLPDNWTLIEDKSCCDTSRYKAIGNGMAQPCADFIVRRIVEVERRIP